MSVWTRDMFADEELDEVGFSLSRFANALQCWSFMQGRPTSVAEAAMTFNTSPEIVMEAIDDSAWMFLTGESTETDFTKLMIEHDGE